MKYYQCEDSKRSEHHEILTFQLSPRIVENDCLTPEKYGWDSKLKLEIKKESQLTIGICYALLDQKKQCDRILAEIVKRNCIGFTSQESRDIVTERV